VLKSVQGKVTDTNLKVTTLDGKLDFTFKEPAESNTTREGEVTALQKHVAELTNHVSEEFGAGTLGTMKESVTNVETTLIRLDEQLGFKEEGAVAKGNARLEGEVTALQSHVDALEGHVKTTLGAVDWEKQEDKSLVTLTGILTTTKGILTTTKETLAKTEQRLQAQAKENEVLQAQAKGKKEEASAILIAATNLKDMKWELQAAAAATDHTIDDDLAHLQEHLKTHKGQLSDLVKLLENLVGESGNTGVTASQTNVDKQSNDD